MVALHTSSTQVHRSTDIDAFARLSGHSPHQTAELLDRLTSNRAPAAWCHTQDTDEVLWQLPTNRPEVIPLYAQGNPINWNHEAQVEK
ncbi:hypothetical protein N8I84_02435 [Streptomyces cynarae]|uniref:Uncharacterized protein n=1 Tax=Streptomyces cynarae TaxID=2981134 RepID=A0ABY6DXG5_9ACTN|nr:hypothetical protein [Streptomyces cynarae]UXY17721.1 hypothetical protein N8I84_02435 [Streptomyces cynarae]